MEKPAVEPGEAEAPAQRADDHDQHVAKAVEAALHVHLREHLTKVEHLVSTGRGHVQHAARQHHLPAWLRPTGGEPRWPVIIVVVAAIALQLAIPEKLTMKPWWLLPAVETVCW